MKLVLLNLYPCWRRYDYFSQNTFLRLVTWLVKNPIFHRVSLRKYNDPQHEISTMCTWKFIIKHLQFSLYESSQKTSYSKNPKMTRLKLNSRWIKNPIFNRLYLRKYNDLEPEMFTIFTLICIISNLQFFLSEASHKKVTAKIPRWLTWRIKILGSALIPNVMNQMIKISE